MKKQCPSCKTHFETEPAQGRPQVFCSVTCQRAAAQERRRINGVLAKVEEHWSHSRLWGKRSTVYRPDEDYQAEVDRLQARMRALLADPGGDE